MMTNPAWAFEIDNTQDWAFVEKLLTPEECKSIINSNEIIDTAKIIKNNQSINDSSIRDSSIKFLSPTNDNKWLYQRITDCVTEANSVCFNFDLFGLTESLQLTKYDAPKGHYDYHLDKCVNSTIRKLSFSILLNDDYDGGDFEILIEKESTKLPKSQGTMLIFPSYILHRVTPVIKGSRYSIVGWITGKPFK